MIRTLGAASLERGGELVVKVIEPPEPEYAEKLAHFLEHKSDASRRGIVSRLSGKYADCCVDRYFVGEIDGSIAGQLWYGYGRTLTGVANFGHVYTEPAHRGRGITSELMRFFVQDFDLSPARAALCGAGKPWVAGIYLRHGFQTIRKGADCGDLILLKRGGPADFGGFERAYYAPGAGTRVVAGTMAHRHDVDKLLAASLAASGRAAARVAMAWPVRSFEDALFRSEDGQGLAAALVAGDDRVMGWAFILSTGSPLEAESKVLDYEVHPNYAGAADALVAGALDLARGRGLGQVWAFAPSGAEAKTATLRRCGFGEAARLDGYCGSGKAGGDLVMMRHGGAA